MAVLPKPSQTPTWATTGAKVEPSAGKKATGWVLNEIPSSSFENFRANLNDQWWSWVSERFSDGASANDLKVDTKSFGINNANSLFGTGFWSDPGVAAATAVSHMAARSFSGQSIWQMVTKDSDLGFSVGATVDSARVITLEAGGNVGVGKTVPANKLHVSATNADGIFVEDSSSSSVGPVLKVRGDRIDNNASQAFAGRVVLERFGSVGLTVNTDILGSILFGGNHTNNLASNISYGASIEGIAEGNYNSVADMPTGLSFRTAAVGNSLTSLVGAGSERMRIAANGNVGIGETVPAVPLHVKGDIANYNPGLANLGSVAVRASDWNTSFRETSIQYRGSTFVGDVVLGIAGANTGQLIFQNNARGLIGTNGGSPITIFTASVPRMTIDGNNNRVGIGETVPSSSLHITSSVTEFIRMHKSNAPDTIWDLAIDGSGSVYLGLPTLGKIPFSVSSAAAANTFSIDSSGILVRDLSSSTTIRLNPFPSTSGYNLDIIADDIGALYSTNSSSRGHRWAVGNVTKVVLDTTFFRPATTNLIDLGSTSFRWGKLWANRGHFTENITTPANQADLVARHANNCVVAWFSLSPIGRTLMSPSWNILSVVEIGLGAYDVTFNQPVNLSSAAIATVKEDSGAGIVGKESFATIFLSSTVMRVFVTSNGFSTNAPFSMVVIGQPSVLP